MLYRWYHTTYLAPQPESVAGRKIGRAGLGQLHDRRMRRGVPFLLSPSPLPFSVPPRQTRRLLPPHSIRLSYLLYLTSNRNFQIFIFIYLFFFLQKGDHERNNKEKRREHITLIQQRRLHYCSSFLVPDLLVFLFSKTLIKFFSVIYP